MAAAGFITNFLLTLLHSTLLISLQFQVQVEAGDVATGFTVDLIHRHSPFLNSLTKYDLLNRAIHHSSSRHRHFSTFNHSSSAIAPVLPSADGDYIMNISIGNPPVQFQGLIDTGSDLIWTQCKPCVKCNYVTIPLFNPRGSSTYNSATCSSAACKSLPPYTRRCRSNKRTCSFYTSYADGSVSEGQLATETFTFDSGKISVPGTAFGCAHYSQTTLNRFESGLIGLAGGASSLIGQTRKSPAFGGRFSLCLIPPFMLTGRRGKHFSGRISFGQKAIMSGPDVVSTPLRTKATIRSLYYLTLESISVGEGKNRIPYINYEYHSKKEEEYLQGNIFIDSGTPMTYLKDGPYNNLVLKLKEAIGSHHQHVSKGYFDLCYVVKEDDSGSLPIPNLIFHFAGGADVELKPSSTFVEPAKGYICLAILPSNEMLDRAIFGSVLQMGYLIGLDLEARTVSFKPMPDCTADHE